MKDSPQLVADRPDIAKPLVAKYGGPAEMARLTGHPVGRIEGWIRIGWIDPKYWPWLRAVARREGISVTPWDFLGELTEILIAA